jgi:hypothetical protein
METETVVLIVLIVCILYTGCCIGVFYLGYYWDFIKEWFKNLFK